MSESRKIGVPYGRTEYVERIERTVYPDGTVTDTEPVRTAAGIAWRTLMRELSKPSRSLPRGTECVLFQRTVVTEATEWTEVPRDEPDPASDVRGD